MNVKSVLIPFTAPVAVSSNVLMPPLNTAEILTRPVEWFISTGRIVVPSRSDTPPATATLFTSLGKTAIIRQVNLHTDSCYVYL